MSFSVRAACIDSAGEPARTVGRKQHYCTGVRAFARFMNLLRQLLCGRRSTYTCSVDDTVNILYTYVFWRTFVVCRSNCCRAECPRRPLVRRGTLCALNSVLTEPLLDGKPNWRLYHTNSSLGRSLGRAPLLPTVPVCHAQCTRTSVLQDLCRWSTPPIDRL